MSGRNPDCRLCPLHQFTPNRCVWGDGPEKARVMIIGEAPGSEEEKEGRPFVGPAGRVLSEVLAEAGLNRSDVYITNVNKCRPPSNRTPYKAERDACLRYLLEEIETVQPEIIVPMGNTALTALTGKATITKERGRSHEPVQGIRTTAKIIPTYHPAATLHRQGKGVLYRPLIVEDLTLVASELSGIDRRVGNKRAIAPPYADCTAALTLLLDDCSTVAIDLEWTAGKGKRGSTKADMIWPWRKKGELFSIALSGRVAGGGIRTVSMAWPGTFSRERSLMEHILREKRIVLHNGVADFNWLWPEVPGFNYAADTMVLGYLIDERIPHDLGAMATKFASLPPDWKGHITPHKPITEQEWRELLTYNALDTETTLILFEHLCQYIAELPPERSRAIRNLHTRLIIPALPVLGRAALAGVPFDEEAVVRRCEKLEEEHDTIIHDLGALTDTEPRQMETIVRSHTKLKAFLSGAFGFDLDATDKSTLTGLKEYPLAAKVIQYRANQKLYSTYLDPWRVMLHRQGDGRIHTVSRPAGTRTGRLSSESEIGGTLQQVPRERWVRELIRAEEGRKIVSGDFSQIELRMIAWLAPERTMARFYEEGVDLHAATAAFILALSRGINDPSRAMEFIPEVMEDRKKGGTLRQDAKGVNFGFAYGMGEEHFQTYARDNYGTVMTREEAHIAREAYFLLYSDLEPWHARKLRETERRGYTETPWGRRRHYNPDEDDMLSCINTEIQSTASDFNLYAMTLTDQRIRELELDATIIGTIHDSILIDCADRHVEDVTHVLQSTMENLDTSPFGFTCPIRLEAEVKEGERWS